MGWSTVISGFEAISISAWKLNLAWIVIAVGLRVGESWPSTTSNRSLRTQLYTLARLIRKISNMFKQVVVSVVCILQIYIALLSSAGSIWFIA